MKNLKQAVLEANLSLWRNNLVFGTQGNVSGIDRSKGIVYIKPSGVGYETMREEMLVGVDLDGKVLEGTLKPSVDTVHHLHLYRTIPGTGGVCHTHSAFVTVFAILGKPVPVLSTGHADVFGQDIPVTQYVDNTADAMGKALLAAWEATRCPAIILGKHGLFSIGDTPAKAAFNASMAEYCAQTAYYAVAGAGAFGAQVSVMTPAEIEKWYGRYHSERYGQKKKG